MIKKTDRHLPGTKKETHFFDMDYTCKEGWRCAQPKHCTISQKMRSGVWIIPGKVNPFLALSIITK